MPNPQSLLRVIFLTEFFVDFFDGGQGVFVMRITDNLSNLSLPD